MKAFLATYQKQLEIAFLLALLVGMDALKIQDVDLKYVLMGLVGSLTGFRGLQSLIGAGGQSAQAQQSLPPGTQVTFTPPAPILNTAATPPAQ